MICDITELPIEMCSHCRRLVSAEEQAAAERHQLLGGSDRRWFEAKFPGNCGVCGERFSPGTAIRFEQGAGWRAECCAGGVA